MRSYYDSVYPHRLFELRHPGDMSKDEIVFELVKKCINKNSNCKILDIGCGMGHTSLLLSKLTPQLVGIDISAEGVKVSKERVNRGFVVADSVRLPFRDECFDCVVMKDVLEHIENDLQAIREVHRVLKYKGILVLYIPYSLDDSISFESIVKKVFGYSIDDKVGHVRRYKECEIKEKLKYFEILETFYFAHFLFGVISIFGILLYNRFINKKIRKETKNLKIEKISLNLLVTGLKLAKSFGKIEFILLRKFKGAGMFVVARKIINKKTKLGL